MKKRLSFILAIMLFVNLLAGIEVVFADGEITPRQIKVSGNKLVYADDPDTMVRLAGINIPSLEWSNTGEHLYESLTEGCDGWNANIVRLPITPSRWFDATTGENYRKLVDDMVKGVNSRGKYLLLDCHTYVMPTREVYDLWMDICDVYGNNPGVLFGLCNEPYGIKGVEEDEGKSQWELWRNGGMISYNSAPTLGYGHQQLVEAIRDKGVKNILVAAGVSWGYDLSGVANGYALVDQGSGGDLSKAGYGIMYDSHIYPSKGLKSNWEKAAGCVRSFAPLLIGEFGWDSADKNISSDTSVYNLWVPQLMDWIDDTDGTYGVPANWTAWCFHPAATPRVITSWKYKPTYYLGKYVKERLLSYPDTRVYRDYEYTNNFASDSFRSYSNLMNGSKKSVSRSISGQSLNLTMTRGADSAYVGLLMNLPSDWGLSGVQKIEFDMTANSNAVTSGMNMEVGFYGSDTELWTKQVAVTSTASNHVTVYVNELRNLVPSVRSDDSFTYGISAFYIGAAKEGSGTFTISNVKFTTAAQPTVPLPPKHYRAPNNPSYLIDNDYEITKLKVYKNDNGPGSSQGDYFRSQIKDAVGYNGTPGLHVEYNRINGIWGGFTEMSYPAGLDFSDAVYWSFMIKGNGDAQNITVRSSPANAVISIAEGDTDWHQYIFRFAQLGCMAPEDITNLQFHANTAIESEFWVDNFQVTKDYPTVFLAPDKVVYENGFEDTLVKVNTYPGSGGSTVTGRYYTDGGYNSQQAYMLSFNNTGTDGGAVAEFRNPSGWDLTKTDTFTFDARSASGETEQIRLGLLDKVGVAAYTGEVYELTSEWQRFTVEIFDFKLNDIAIVNSRIVGLHISSEKTGASSIMIDNISFSNYMVEPPVPNSVNYINTFDPDVYGNYESVGSSETSYLTAAVTENAGYENTKGLVFENYGTQGTGVYVNITDLPEEWDFSKAKYISLMVKGNNPIVTSGYQVNGSVFTMELYYDYDDGSGNTASIKTGTISLNAHKDTWSNIITAIVPNTTNYTYMKNTNRIKVYSNRSVNGGFTLDNIGFHDMKPERVIPVGNAVFTETFDSSSNLDLKFTGGCYIDQDNYLFRNDLGGYKHWGLSIQSDRDAEGPLSPSTGTDYIEATIPASWELFRTTHISFMARLNQSWRTSNFSTVYSALPAGGLTKTNMKVSLLDGDMHEYSQELILTNNTWTEFSLPLSGFVDSSGNSPDLMNVSYIRIYPDLEEGQSGFNLDNLSFSTKETGVSSVYAVHNGEMLKNLITSGTVTVNAEMLSAGQAVTVYAALYDGNELKKVVSRTSSNALLTLDVPVSGNTGSYVLKVFVWGKDSVKPMKNGYLKLQ